MTGKIYASIEEYEKTNLPYLYERKQALKKKWGKLAYIPSIYYNDDINPYRKF